MRVVGNDLVDYRHLMGLDVHTNLSQRHKLVMEMHHSIPPGHFLQPILSHGAYELRSDSANRIGNGHRPQTCLGDVDESSAITGN